jgi:hypothetical protein
MLKFCRWDRTPPDVHFEKVLNETQVFNTTLELLISFLKFVQRAQVYSSIRLTSENSRVVSKEPWEEEGRP